MTNATTTVSGLNQPTIETTEQSMHVLTGEMQYTGNMVDTDPLLGETGLVDENPKREREGLRPLNKRKKQKLPNQLFMSGTEHEDVLSRHSGHNREGEDLRPLNKRKRQDLPIQLFMSGPEHEDVLSTHFGHQGFFGQNIDRDGAASGPGRCEDAMEYVLKNSMLVTTCAAMACTSAGMCEILQPLMNSMNPACNKLHCVRCFGHAIIAMQSRIPICCRCFQRKAVTYKPWMQELMMAKQYIDTVTDHDGYSWVHLSCLRDNSDEATELYRFIVGRMRMQRCHIKNLEKYVNSNINLQNGWDDPLPDKETDNVCRACDGILTITQKRSAHLCGFCFAAYSVPLTTAQYDVNTGLYGVRWDCDTGTYRVPTVSLRKGNPLREAIQSAAKKKVHDSNCGLRSVRERLACNKSDIGKLLTEKKLARTEHAYTTVHFNQVGDVRTDPI
jgi:hypothetical protein